MVEFFSQIENVTIFGKRICLDWPVKKYHQITSYVQSWKFKLPLVMILLQNNLEGGTVKLAALKQDVY